MVPGSWPAPRCGCRGRIAPGCCSRSRRRCASVRQTSGPYSRAYRQRHTPGRARRCSTSLHNPHNSHARSHRRYRRYRRSNWQSLTNWPSRRCSGSAGCHSSPGTGRRGHPPLAHGLAHTLPGRCSNHPAPSVATRIRRPPAPGRCPHPRPTYTPPIAGFRRWCR